jgi:hypothetical protein
VDGNKDSALKIKKVLKHQQEKEYHKITGKNMIDPQSAKHINRMVDH